MIVINNWFELKGVLIHHNKNWRSVEHMGSCALQILRVKKYDPCGTLARC